MILGKTDRVRIMELADSEKIEDFDVANKLIEEWHSDYDHIRVFRLPIYSIRIRNSINSIRCLTDVLNNPKMRLLEKFVLLHDKCWFNIEHNTFEKMEWVKQLNQLPFALNITISFLPMETDVFRHWLSKLPMQEALNDVNLRIIDESESCGSLRVTNKAFENAQKYKETPEYKEIASQHENLIGKSFYVPHYFIPLPVGTIEILPNLKCIVNAKGYDGFLELDKCTIVETSERVQYAKDREHLWVHSPQGKMVARFSKECGLAIEEPVFGTQYNEKCALRIDGKTNKENFDLFCAKVSEIWFIEIDKSQIDI